MEGLMVVEYQAGEIAFFLERTPLIDPKHFALEYSYLRSCVVNGEMRPAGCLPDEFRDRMNAAAINKEEWRAKDRQNFLNWFG
jgi:hypothetical protein